MTNQIKTLNGINQQTFNQLIETAKTAGLSEEEIKLKIGDLSIPWKDDRVQPVKTATDEQKLILYDKLRVGDLPFDWELRLLRKEDLEKKQDGLLKTEGELKGWTDTFPNKKPQEIKEQITKLENEKTNQKEQLEQDKKDSEKLLTDKINKLEKELNAEKVKNSKNTTEKDQQIKELKEEINKWQIIFNKPIDKAQEEYKELVKRPKLPITVKEFWDDYARRWTKEHSDKMEKELNEARAKADQYWKEKQAIWRGLEKWASDEILRKYILAKPVITKDQATATIKELLSDIDDRWGDFLEKNIITNRNLFLAMNLTKNTDKMVDARQVLDWVREARNNQIDYQKLFENWAGGKDYNKERDFDGGSLYFLSSNLEKYTSIKNFGTPKIGSV